MWLKYQPEIHIKNLLVLIKLIQPDLIHSLEFQGAGYLTLKAKKLSDKNFPLWAATNWGSDIYFFGQYKKHADLIKQVIANIGYYFCECQRDIKLAKNFGFSKVSFLSTTNAGGYDIGWTAANQVYPASKRKLILLKGYQGWAGRALVGLSAIENIIGQLSDYTLCIYSINPPDSGVVEKIKELNRKFGLKYIIIPLNTPHNEILKLHGQSRISIGLSISDSLSISMIEALVMGSLPIQSNTACTEGWLINNKNGLVVLPENLNHVSEALKKALTDDRLVDRAQKINNEIAKNRLSYPKLKAETLSYYHQIFHTNTRG